MTDARALLRSLPVFATELPDFDTGDLPAEPMPLFETWLDQAIEAGVAEPHAMTLSTVAADGTPDARVLILKDLADGVWWFATSSRSVKGRQLAAVPAAALTFYWPAVGRQIRVRGRIVCAPAEQSAADFRDRSDGARAIALASDGGGQLADRAECLAAVAAAAERLGDEVLESWTLYGVVPHEVEFWQADRERIHTRVLYRQAIGGWDPSLQWP